jgi:hypothetical protein
VTEELRLNPGSVRIPLVGALFAQLVAVNVPLAKVGQVPVAAVRMSVNGWPETTTEAANVAAVSKLGEPFGIAEACDASGVPVLNVFRHHSICVAPKRGSASIASIFDS